MRGSLLALGCTLLLTAVFAPAAQAVTVHIPRGKIALPPPLSGRTLSGVAVDGAGNLYTGARGSNGNSVAVFGPDGAHIRSFDIGSIKANSGRDGGHSSDDLDLAVGPDGLLYVGQPIPDLGAPQDRYISVYTTSGSLVRELMPNPDNAKFWIGDLELDPAGNIYVLVRHNGPGAIRGGPVDEVLRIDPGGTITARFPLTREETSVFETELGGLALAPDGSIWVTTPLDGSRLIHLAADGGPRPASPKLDAIVDLKTRSVEDVDFADGMLYIAAGRPNGMVVITPEGLLVDRIPGEARQLAGAGDNVYATKLNASTAVRPVRAAQSNGEDALAKFLAARASRPEKPSGFGLRGPCPGVNGIYPDPLVHVTIPRSGLDELDKCTIFIDNYSTPNCPEGPATSPNNVYVGGQELGPDVLAHPTPPRTARIRLDPADLREGGNLIVEWACPNFPSSVFEAKGAIDLIDPNGNVFDAKTSKPIQFATVRLQFTPVRGGAFGVPSLSLMRPQVHPQTTGADGAFGWDVAPGFWRLVVNAFGYRQFTSETFEIPPEVTGLKLRMKRSAAFRRLIDPAGSVGDLRIGARLRRKVGGLRIGLQRDGRIREIGVRSKAFRTAAGIKLRSTEADLLRAYPAAKQSGKVRGGTKVLRFRRALFSVRGGRITAIRLAR